MVAIKKCGHTTNHLPKSLRTLTMKQHATGVQLVTTSGNRIVLMAGSNAGIAGTTYGRTIDRKHSIVIYSSTLNLYILKHVECTILLHNALDVHVLYCR